MQNDATQIKAPPQNMHHGKNTSVLQHAKNYGTQNSANSVTGLVLCESYSQGLRIYIARSMNLKALIGHYVCLRINLSMSTKSYLLIL